MRIVFSAARFPPDVGGVERYTLGIARTLARLGHDVTIVTNAVAPEMTDLRVVAIPALRALNGRFPIPSPLRALHVARAAMPRTSAPRALVVQTRFYPLSLICALAARIQGWPVLVIEHGSTHLAFENPLVDPLVAAWEHIAAIALRMLRAHFAGVSEPAAAWLRHFGIRTSAVVPNGVDDVENGCSDVRERFALFVGRAIPQKGLPVLLEAFARFAPAHPGWRLVVAGADRADAALAPNVAERVTWLGVVPGARVAALLRACGMLVVPSTRPEGMPTTILEAGRAAAPVVATAMGGTMQLIRDGDTGVLVWEATAAALADGMARIADDPAAAMDAGEALRCEVERRYTWPRIAENLLETLELPLRNAR